MKKVPFYSRWYKRISLPFEIGHFRWTANWAWGEAVNQQDVEKIRELQHFGIFPSLAKHNHDYLSSLIGTALTRYNLEIFDAVMDLKIPVQCFNAQLPHHSDGNSFLHYAGSYPHKFHCLLKMLDYGVTTQGYLFDTYPLPLSVVKSNALLHSNTNTKVATTFLAWKMVAVLAERGMNLNTKEKQESLFEYAESPARMRWLIKKGCVLTESIQHNLILQWAKDERMDLITWLLKVRGDLNPLNQDGQTPFHALIHDSKRGQSKVILKALDCLLPLNNHSNLLLPDKKGNTFLHTLTELEQVKYCFYTPDILAKIPSNLLNQAVLIPNKQGKTPLMNMLHAQRKLEDNAIPWIDQWILRFRLNQVDSKSLKSKYRL